jgi:hypothetical protein
MRTRSFLLAASLGAALGSARGESRSVPEPRAAAPAAVAALAALSAFPADTAEAAARRDASLAASREHAPLAWFSVGSLAIGGVFYAIGRGSDRPSVSFDAGDRARMGTAVAVAGASALLAAGAYFYYVRKAGDRAAEEADWEASISGAPDGAGGLAVSARVSLPLPSFR